ncbi:Membrane-associated oxidoreductase OS=Streptomyces glaucescens OX=1907 GN=SGLAU_09320 PE=4 SV=1 [Streptomyces glaucescens]
MTEGAALRTGDIPDDLTAAEAGMWQAFRSGTVYDLRSGDSVIDDPHGGKPWGPERERAVGNRVLAAAGRPARPGRPGNVLAAA